MIRPASMRAIAKRKTAYHEAGHAVLGRVLTLVCDSATIKPDHDSAGHSLTHDPWASIYEWEKRGKVREPDAVWHARIIGFMAGAGGRGKFGQGGRQTHNLSIMSSISVFLWVRMCSCQSVTSSARSALAMASGSTRTTRLSRQALVKKLLIHKPLSMGARSA